MTLDRTITTWHGTYRLYSGGQADRTSSREALFFLLASLRRRDPEVLLALARSSHGLLSRPLPVFHQVYELPDALLESTATDLEWRVASGQICIEKVDPLKDLHIHDVPQPQPELFAEPPEEVVAAAPVDVPPEEVVAAASVDEPPPPPATVWYEVVVTDENEKPIENAKVVFTIGGQTYSVPTDSEGKARIDDVEAQEATAKILLPDNNAPSAAADQ